MGQPRLDLFRRWLYVQSADFPALIFRADRGLPDVSLVRLIRESEGFADMKTTPSEVDIIRAIRQHLPDVLEARILVSSPQNSDWYASGSRSETTGGYEIRRKDWRSVRSLAVPLRKQDWDAKTVYLVRIRLYDTLSLPSPDESGRERGTNGVPVS